ncbi:hypothetical protein [Pseudomonas aeruginosa]|uniref:hypothetical protein n=1 Tax=Pseudomonas aeruginosa TaxID=287 RepID=UPI00104C7165|nr:hypothetical protein [Pseudomonas aeruginosa]
MNTDLAPVEIYIPADAWLKPVAVPHSMTHEDIDRLVSEFMSSGGAIKEIPVGVSGDSAPAMFNGRIRSMGKQTARRSRTNRLLLLWMSCSIAVRTAREPPTRLVSGITCFSDFFLTTSGETSGRTRSVRQSERTAVNGSRSSETNSGSSTTGRSQRSTE